MARTFLTLTSQQWRELHYTSLLLQHIPMVSRTFTLRASTGTTDLGTVSSPGRRAPWCQRWQPFYLCNPSVLYKMPNKYLLKEWVSLIILSFSIFENLLIFKNNKLQAITGCVFLFHGKLDRILALPCWTSRLQDKTLQRLSTRDKSWRFDH